MTNQWHFLKVRTGDELRTHCLLVAIDGVKCYTPFETKWQKHKGNRNAPAKAKRKPYASPIWPGYVAFSIDTPKALGTVLSLSDARPFIFGPLVKGEQPDTMSEQERASIEHYLTHSGGKWVSGVSFDPKTHARKHMSKIYADARPIPTFTDGERVTFTDGPFAGFTAKVVRSSGDTVRILQELMGREVYAEVDPFHLRRAG